MAWPLKREAALATLLCHDGDVEDLLLLSASSAPLSASSAPLSANLFPCHQQEQHQSCIRNSTAVVEEEPHQQHESGESSENSGDGPAPYIGRRYWSWQALTRLQVSRAAVELAAMTAPGSRSRADPCSAIERGAVLLVSWRCGCAGEGALSSWYHVIFETETMSCGAQAQVHYPASNLDVVVRQLDMLGEELRVRLREAGATRGGRKVSFGGGHRRGLMLRPHSVSGFKMASGWPRHWPPHMPPPMFAGPCHP